MKMKSNHTTLSLHPDLVPCKEIVAKYHGVKIAPVNSEVSNTLVYALINTLANTMVKAAGSKPLGSTSVNALGNEFGTRKQNKGA